MGLHKQIVRDTKLIINMSKQEKELVMMAESWKASGFFYKGSFLNFIWTK